MTHSVRLLRLLLPALILALVLAAGATAGGTVRQSGSTSQRRPVSLRMTGAQLSVKIAWRARCRRQVYSGRSRLDRVPVRRGRFSTSLRYSHRLPGGRRARVVVTLAGRASRTRASGTWRGVVRVDRVGTCRSGRVTWRTRARRR